MNVVRWRSSSILGLTVVLCLTWQSIVSAATKHVILMISDGAGFNTWNATSMYEGKWDAATGRSTQIYNGPGWVQLACSTFPLNTSKVPTHKGVQDATLVYNPAKAWNREDGYAWLKSTFTDSAAAATALSTGQKTYNHALNWSDMDRPISPTMCEAAKAAGKAAGVITTVYWSHATPAGLSNAHADQRDNYAQIATQMLDGRVMDVVMGAGNPDYDNNGAKFTGKKKDYPYVGGAATWKALEEARARPGKTYQGFRPVSTKAEFEALISGPTPTKVVGTAQVGSTLQQSRKATKTNDPAQDTPPTPGLPTLVTMTKGALNVLCKNPNGLFLMIEGGAVDWANHKNQLGRMVQEQVEFNAAVQAVVEWIDANSNWQDTLLVITADHETGLLWGPHSDTVAFDPIVNNGPGQMPTVKYNSKNHANSLVPVFARGRGSELLTAQVVGRDPVRGPYVDNTIVARTLQNALGAAPTKDSQ